MELGWLVGGRDVCWSVESSWYFIWQLPLLILATLTEFNYQCLCEEAISYICKQCCCWLLGSVIRDVVRICRWRGRDRLALYMQMCVRLCVMCILVTGLSTFKLPLHDQTNTTDIYHTYVYSYNITVCTILYVCMCAHTPVLFAKIVTNTSPATPRSNTRSDFLVCTESECCPKQFKGKMESFHLTSIC